MNDSQEGPVPPGAAIAFRQHARYDVLVDVDLERVRDDARDPPLATTTKNDQLLLESQRRSDAGRHATLLNPGISTRIGNSRPTGTAPSGPR